jgi:hypothetical protein
VYPLFTTVAKLNETLNEAKKYYVRGHVMQGIKKSTKKSIFSPVMGNR